MRERDVLAKDWLIWANYWPAIHKTSGSAVDLNALAFSNALADALGSVGIGEAGTQGGRIQPGVCAELQ